VGNPKEATMPREKALKIKGGLFHLPETREIVRKLEERVTALERYAKKEPKI
jgi:hypothetical protein